jgi:hypothetical protein
MGTVARNFDEGMWGFVPRLVFKARNLPARRRQHVDDCVARNELRSANGSARSWGSVYNTIPASGSTASTIFPWA